jgi:predicted adenylyl cyclase CyaB
MKVNNYEFKVKVDDINKYESILKELKPEYNGVDNQTDTYFNLSKGRLKLREGNIENALIYYEREDEKGAKRSDVILYKCEKDSGLKEILTKVHGVKVVVKKKRRIYFIDNVKFHFDDVEGLGQFVEVEAIDKNEDIGIEKLKEQCDKYIEVLGIRKEDFVDCSYSDMLLNGK